jgi:hypothetical protein
MKRMTLEEFREWNKQQKGQQNPLAQNTGVSLKSESHTNLHGLRGSDKPEKGGGYRA